MNATISETCAIKGFIAPQSETTGTLVSNWALAAHTDKLQAVLSVGDIVGSADISIEQAYPNTKATGIVLTAAASATATVLVVSGGTYEVNDWVSADGVNFVMVTSALVGAGSLAVTALPADVYNGASVTALKSATTVAALSTGRTTGSDPFAPSQTPAEAEAAGVYTLDVRASDVNNNNPAPAGDGTGGGYNPVQYARIKITLDVGSTSALVSGLLLDAVKNLPAYNFNAPKVVVNQIQA